MTIALDRPADNRASRLKALTHTTHDRLDKTIMAGEPFASRERYVLFLKVQHAFHREIDALYSDPALDRLLPDLTGRRRFGLIEQDLADLGTEPPPAEGAPVFRQGDPADVPTALGWLYVAEGSNLGAAFLLKAAAGLGLSATFGARHLAAAPQGRGLHWKTFTIALDGLELSEADETRVTAGAKAAFARVHALVVATFG
ncbi:biliverdin-producing heme oxygenase [Xanthobacter dioxanivorans]|uniref:Biliverdin-producing heme oxygenase n=1 Tax=Xanthobacter dioxanivorans TaxID=2528964 RepID=A0A974SHG2_9HYPH|nr:biliverdin-producing heme oxygenase [Xanthobacter dioxanivorans]QRG06251.1 biliverdin-producing heme oxygenase [Xanthobacter dioxanivorans]